MSRRAGDGQTGLCKTLPPVHLREQLAENPAENAAPRCVKCLTFLWHLKYTVLKVIGFWRIHINIIADLFIDIFTNYLLLPLTNGCRGALPDALPWQAVVRSQFSHAK